MLNCHTHTPMSCFEVASVGDVRGITQYFSCCDAAFVAFSSSPSVGACQRAPARVSMATMAV